METRHPCKTWETQFMWRRVYFFRNFESAPGERLLISLKQQYLIFTKLFNIEIVSEYTLRDTESCVWISVNMNMYFWWYIKNPVFSFEIPGPALILLRILPTLTFHQNTNLGLKKRIRVFFHLKCYHTLKHVCTSIKPQENF